MAHHLSMSRLPGTKREADSGVPLSHVQLPPHSTAFSLPGGELEPLPWSQQSPGMGRNAPESLASGRVVAREQCLTSSTDWLRPPSFEWGSTESDDLEPELFQSHSVPWAPSSLPASASDSAQLTVDGTSYPLAPLDPESTTDIFLAIPRQHYELAEPREYQLQLVSEPGNLCNGKGRVPPDTCAGDDETWGRKRIRRPPIQIQTIGLDADLPRCIPSAALALRRDSTFSISPMMSSPESTTGPAFDIMDTYPLSNSNRTGTTIRSPSPDATTMGKRKPPRPRRRARTGTCTPATTTTNAGGKKKPTLQARNRAAASRYRAKTQAASAQLEANERDASVRHQLLLACAGELRDEVFRLKTELLRHAACDCPLIRGYLSRAAEEVCKGWVSSSPGPGLGTGLEPEELEEVSEEVSEEW